ncbi:helix-turn-helix domain-containing protein [Peribacillus simplex]|uniref:Helix-turn-helix domain-containing protein n=1 Tax=Peribacillus simplex TaxID=1478 RepID=A0A8B5XTH0_9BACI|nr:helix-turn-helix domain-containing protein [Peribacillus simplex]TVX77168.1 helix-turn-helix domain-containing protein [Peribacillus simplex]
MERTLNTEEALKILKDCYITDSVQTLRKWIREEKIIAAGSPFKQEGYTIKEDDLKAFIEEERPGFLEILKVYHEVNDRIPIGIASIISSPKTVLDKTVVPDIEKEEKILLEPNSNELGTIFEMLLELEQQIKELHVNVENVKKGGNESNEFEKRIEFKIEHMKEKMKNDILFELNSQISLTKPKTEKNVQHVNHKEKSEEEFLTFLRKQCWNPHPLTYKLKGEDNKIFKEKARSCYSLFYDENGQFRDAELGSVNRGGFELVIVVNNQELIIKGQNRKELINQYFKNVFLPNMQKKANSLENTRRVTKHENEEKDEDNIETINLADKIKSGEKETAETKI